MNYQQLKSKHKQNSQWISSPTPTFLPSAWAISSNSNSVILMLLRSKTLTPFFLPYSTSYPISSAPIRVYQESNPCHYPSNAILIQSTIITHPDYCIFPFDSSLIMELRFTLQSQESEHIYSSAEKTLKQLTIFLRVKALFFKYLWHQSLSSPLWTHLGPLSA